MIPLYNERPTLAAVLQELRRHYRGDVLLVDDGSDDGSVESLDASSRAGLEILTHPRNLGYGASLAMAYAILCRGELLVQGRTEHAAVDGEGRVRRIPREDRERLARHALRPARSHAPEH